MQDFTKLRVWHLARQLSSHVIDALPERSTRRVPGLRSQAIRAVRSVGANLAEGSGRATRTDFLHFVEISISSLNELDDHLLAARDARMIAPHIHEQLQTKSSMLRRMLISLTRAIQRGIAQDQSRKLDSGPRSATKE
jgi:four helix bundle protein